MAHEGTESEFEFHELFFSRTNPKGQILAGNQVFTRVSGYRWEELENKAHSIVRHADMPKAVFFLLWDKLKKGLPIGAYVKNCSKNGAYYWVFALAMPVSSGFLSVRLKPSSKFFDIVRGEYQALRQKEVREKLSAEASAQLLLQRIKELGFKDYEDFATQSLAEEIACRQIKLQLPPLCFIDDLRKIQQRVHLLEEGTTEVLKAYQRGAYAPLNLEIKSSKIGGGGGNGMSVVSSQFQEMVSEIKVEIEHFQEAIQKVSSSLADNQFLLSANFLLEDVRKFYEQEAKNASDNVSSETENGFLSELIDAQKEKISESFKSAKLAIGQLEAQCRDLLTSVSGLEIVRLTGKIEASIVPGDSRDLQELISQLGILQKALASTIQSIGANAFEIRETLERLA